MGKFNGNKDIVLKGVGKTLVKGLTSGRVVTFEKCQNLNVNHKTDSEKLYGGDSLSPIYDYAKQSETTVKLTSATFKPSQLGLIMASEVNTSGVRSQDIAHLVKGDTKISEYTIANVKVLFAADEKGEPVEVVDTGSPTGKQISVTASGEVKFGDSVEEHAAFDMVYEYDADGVQTKVLGDALPELVEVFITFYPTDLENNSKVFNIHIPKARCDGNFTMDTKRDQASTPELTFNAFKKEGQNREFTITVADRPQKA